MKVSFAEIQSKSEKQEVRKLYNKSVPVHEKAYFYPLWWKRKRADVSFLSIYDSDKWVGFVFYSTYENLVYVWFFATYDSKDSKKYDSAMLDELKRLHPKHRIAVSIESENKDARNAEQSAKEKAFYEKSGFEQTGYFVKRKSDSFEIMLLGDFFEIEELYAANKRLYPLLGRLIVSGFKKHIQKK